MSDLKVVVHDVTKTYRTTFYRDGGWKLKRQQVTAVDDVSLLVRAGESVGVLGQNGSGKSTLMRLIGGQERPSAGEIFVAETPALLGVSAALVGHLSGVENIKLGCLAKGMHPDDLDHAIEDVAEFCDIGSALYRPMETYSSGMAARLRFGIATTMQPEILIVDEALSTGDAAFNKRAKDRMQTFLSASSTKFIVSHVAKTIQELCERSIWIHEGKVIADGATEEIGVLYDDWVRHKNQGKAEGADALVKKVSKEFPPAPFSIESRD